MPLALKRPPRFTARASRRGVYIPAALLLPDDGVLEITVRNLSPRGFMASCPAPVRSGDWVGVELPGYGIARAMVRWSDDGEVGCRFRTPMNVARCIDVTSRAPVRSLFALNQA